VSGGRPRPISPDSVGEAKRLIRRSADREGQRLHQPQRPQGTRAFHDRSQMIVKNDPERIERLAQSTCPRRRVTASGRHTDDCAPGSRRRH
jgi:hypothetical protein